MSKKLNSMTEIHEKDFFDLEHPDNVCVEIQFKTGFAKNPRTTEEIWTPVSIMNNYFDNITITDVSGFQTMDLYLKDRDFVNLENIVLKTLMCSRIGNAASFYNSNTLSNLQNTNITGGTQPSAENPPSADSMLKSQFQFYIDNQTAECIRVRFGHSLKSPDMSIPKFKGRTKYKKGTVIMTDWIYFILLNVNYNIGQDGFMSFLFKGISANQTYLERAKLMLNGTRIKGTAKEIWHILKTYIESSSNMQIQLQEDSNESETQYFPAPQHFFEHQGNKQLVLNSLYEKVRTIITEQGEERMISFKSLKQLLDDFVGLMKPIYRKKDGGTIKPEELDSDEKEKRFEIHHIEKPMWFARLMNSEKLPQPYTAIGLYYASPLSENNEQTIKRVYSWKDAPNSLIKNFSVTTDNDFAMLNAPICLRNKDGETEMVNFKSVYSGASAFNNKIDTICQLKEGLNDLLHDPKKGNTLDGFIAADAFSVDNNNTFGSFIDSFVNNINDSVFKGEIEIPLDPFYLFDDEMLPYVYIIKLDINRPVSFNANNEIKVPGKSYLSGNYMISKITHTISYNSATTKLGVIKFPDVADDYDDTKETYTTDEKIANSQKLLAAYEAEIKSIEQKQISLFNEFYYKQNVLKEAMNRPGDIVLDSGETQQQFFLKKQQELDSIRNELVEAEKNMATIRANIANILSEQ